MSDVLEEHGRAPGPACTRHPDRPAVVALVIDRLDRQGPVATRFLCQECNLALLSWWYGAAPTPVDPNAN